MQWYSPASWWTKPAPSTKPSTPPVTLPLYVNATIGLAWIGSIAVAYRWYAQEQRRRRGVAAVDPDTFVCPDAVCGGVISDDDLLLIEVRSFSAAPPLQWINKPQLDSAVRIEGPNLRLSTEAKTDFWQRTHYGFRPDNGHCYGVPIAGDFVMSVRIQSKPRHQYDQAGLIVRLSSDSWLKTSCEFEPDEPSRMGAVVTNYGYSDWSTEEFEQPPAPGVQATTSYYLRIRREGNDFIVEWSAAKDGAIKWTQLRMAHLHEARGRPIFAGIYACSPIYAGFVAEFSNFSLKRGRI